MFVRRHMLIMVELGTTDCNPHVWVSHEKSSGQPCLTKKEREKCFNKTLVMLSDDSSPPLSLEHDSLDHLNIEHRKSYEK